MKISHENVVVGDLLLVGKASRLRVVHVKRITKSGSLYCSYYECEDFQTGLDQGYYGYSIEIDIDLHNKHTYIQKSSNPTYQEYFWKIDFIPVRV